MQPIVIPHVGVATDVSGDGDPKVSGSFGEADLVSVREHHRQAQIAYLAALGKGRRTERGEEAKAKRQALVETQKDLSFARRAFL